MQNFRHTIFIVYCLSCFCHLFLLRLGKLGLHRSGLNSLPIYQRISNLTRMKRIYMDHSATTPVAPEVLEAMLPYFREKFGNASSLHGYGLEAKEALEDSREKVARLLGANPEEIIFTSGGTESDNLALKGIARRGKEKGKHIITSSVEHPAILETCRNLQKDGFEVTYL
jgi:cysteine desulfurase